MECRASKASFNKVFWRAVSWAGGTSGRGGGWRVIWGPWDPDCCGINDEGETVREQKNSDSSPRSMGFVEAISESDKVKLGPLKIIHSCGLKKKLKHVVPHKARCCLLIMVDYPQMFLSFLAVLNPLENGIEPTDLPEKKSYTKPYYETFKGVYRCPYVHQGSPGVHGAQVTLIYSRGMNL